MKRLDLNQELLMSDATIVPTLPVPGGGLFLAESFYTLCRIHMGSKTYFNWPKWNYDR